MKKVVLAYSGGLDTSVILKWLQEEKNLEVITYTADLGQGDISDDLEEKAKSLGAIKVIVDDLTEEFISDYVFPMFRCNTCLLYTSPSPRDCKTSRMPSSA